MFTIFYIFTCSYAYGEQQKFHPLFVAVLSLFANMRNAPMWRKKYFQLFFSFLELFSFPLLASSEKHFISSSCVFSRISRLHYRLIKWIISKLNNLLDSRRRCSENLRKTFVSEVSVNGLIKNSHPHREKIIILHASCCNFTIMRVVIEMIYVITNKKALN